MITLSAHDVDLDTTPISEPPARQRFRTVLAQVATDAKQALPAAVNGRVEAACQLILRGDVLLQPDGSAVVGSQTSAETTYTVRSGNQCSCPDAAHRAELQGWCKHAVARAMAISLQRRLADTTEASAQPTTPTPAPLPEAPASVNVHLTIGGRQVQLTLRDANEARLLARLEAVLARFPLATPVAAAAAAQAPPAGAVWCHKHNIAMTQQHNAKGSWWSHKTATGFCKGK